MTNQVNNRDLSFADSASYIVGRLTALQDVTVQKLYKSLYPTTKARLDHANEIIESIINEYNENKEISRAEQALADHECDSDAYLNAEGLL